MFFSWQCVIAALPFFTNVEAVYPTVSTWAGSTDGSSGLVNGFGTNARLYKPFDVDITPNLNWAYVPNYGNHQLRRINRRTAEVTLAAGSPSGQDGITDGQGTSAKFSYPIGLDISSDGTFAIVVDNISSLIRRVEIPTHVVTTIAGQNGVYSLTNGIGTVATFSNARGVSISPDNSYALIADQSHNAIRKIVLSTKEVTTFAGQSTSGASVDDVGTNARFNYPNDLDISSDGTYALVTDRGNNQLRKIIISTQVVTTLVTSLTGGLNGVSMSRDISYALIALDSGIVKKLIISTVAVNDYVGHSGGSNNVDGDGTTAGFNTPVAVVISPTGRSALVADLNNHNMRKIQIRTPPVHLYLR